MADDGLRSPKRFKAQMSPIVLFSRVLDHFHKIDPYLAPYVCSHLFLYWVNKLTNGLIRSGLLSLMNRALIEPMGGFIRLSLKLIACSECYVTFGVNSAKLLQWTCCTDGWRKGVLRGGARERERKGTGKGKRTRQRFKYCSKMTPA